MNREAESSPALETLVHVLASTRALRLTARPGRITVDRPTGPQGVEVAWDEAQHRAALEFVSTGRELGGGVSAKSLGETLWLVKPPDVLPTVDDWARDAGVSALAARFLSGTLATGRNVLIVGPWAAGEELALALVGEGQRPMVVGRGTHVAPTAWPRLAGEDAHALSALGPDRCLVSAESVGELAALLAGVCGGVGVLDARRLDRGLLRFEAGLERDAEVRSTPLHVLAAVDVVVVLGVGVGPRVREIAELVLAPDGYRPQLVFATGLPPAPSAQMPVACPAWIDELAAVGLGVVADELRAVVATLTRVATPAPVVAAPPVAPAPAQSASRQPAYAPIPVARGPVSEPAASFPRVEESLRAAPPPGWELDQLGVVAETNEGGAATAEEAAMAASFGLGPPPRPAGLSVETLSFQDILRRVRDRDEP